MKKIFFVLIAFLLFIGHVSSAEAHVFNLFSTDSLYEPEDTVLVTLEVTNSLTVEKDFDVYVSLTEENDSYPPYAAYYNVNLLPDETKNITVYNTTVSEYMVNGYYTVHADLIQDGFALYDDEIRFSIAGLPEVMDFYLVLSDDPGFATGKEVFLMDHRVYLGYNCSEEGIEVDGALTFPDGDTTIISLPVDLVFDGCGVYSLSVEASKEGFRSVNESTLFAVIERTPFSEDGTEISAEIPWMLIIAIILVAVIIAAVVILHRKDYF